MQKDKIFLMFSDVDNTITPTDEKTKNEFAMFAKELFEKNNVLLKFCPISGRDSYHVSKVMKDLNKPFENVGLKNVVDIGAGEQGCCYAFRENPEKNRPLVLVNQSLRDAVRDVVKTSQFAHLVLEEEGTLVVNLFKVYPELTKGMSKEEATRFNNDTIESIKKIIEERVGEKIQCTKCTDSSVGVLEVVPKGFGKHIAVKKLFEKHQQKYDVVGMCYCGDHGNDLSAIDYMSRLAEVPGTKTFVFIPKNAQECTKNPEIKKWQDKMGDLSSGRVIRQGNFNTLKGILDAMKKEYELGNLIGLPHERRFSVDDLATTKSNRQWIEKLQKKNISSKNEQIKRILD